MKPRPWLLAACISAQLFTPAPAAAQAKAPTSAKAADPAKDKALPYLKAGNRAANAGQWDDAYAELAIAWKLYRDWETALGVGKAAYKTKHFAEAIVRLSFALREAPPGRLSAKQRADVDYWIRDAKKKTGTITVTAPGGAEILVDGEPIGTAPLPEPVPADPGKHTLEAKLGTSTESKDVDVTAGANAAVTFAPPKPVEDPTLAKRSESSRNWGRTAVLVGGGALAVGGLVTGGVSLAMAADKGAKKQEASKDPNGRTAAQGFAQDEASARNAALWGFVGGGLAAAGTAVFFFATRPKAKPPVTGGIGVTPAGPTVWVEGQF